MHKLFTDFIQIGTSGATTDGRNIEAEWLTKIAANYDPAIYTALISWEHREKRYFGNYGKVHALEARQLAGDKVGLFAVLAPNEYLMAMNKDGQSLFPSMEIDLDFADTSEPYLTGMAVTDSPASLGTGELRFGQEALDKNTLFVFSEVEAFKDLALSETPPASTAALETTEPPAPADAFSKDEIGLVRRLLNHFSKPGGDTTADDGEPMSPEEKAQFEKMSADIVILSAAVAATSEAIKSLDEKFSAIKPDDSDGNTGDKGGDKGGDKTGDETEAQAFSEIKTQLESTQATVLALSEKLSKAIGTPAGNTDDGGDDSGDGENPDDFV